MPYYPKLPLARRKPLFNAFLVLLALAAVLLAAPVSAADDVPAVDPDGIQQLQAEVGGQAQISVNRATGTASFVRLPKGDGVVAAAAATPEEAAKQWLTRHGGIFGIKDVNTDLKLLKVTRDPIGNARVAYQQIYQGVDVFAAILYIHVDGRNSVFGANGTTVPKIAVNPNPALSKEVADQIAVRTVKAQDALDADPSNVSAVASKLYVFRAGLVQRIEGASYLVYEVEVANPQLTIREYVYVDAHSGRIIDQITGITGIEREISEQTLANVVWDEGNGDPNPIPAGWAGGTAQLITDWQNELDGASETYNFVASMTGGTYLSYDAADAVMRTVNNDPTIACPNANWNGVSTNYCTDVTGDDTVAHEWGHAYTQYTSDLIYQWQPGAMNEAMSDIFGEIVDLINGRGTDGPDVLRASNVCSSNVAGANFSGNPTLDTVRWLSGEDDPAFNNIPAGSGNAIRDMWDPTCFGHPGKVSDTQYFCATTDSGGVHRNSGVVNHAFALLVDGSTYNNVTVPAIGLTKAAHLFWRAQTTYLSQASDFTDLANALDASCQDLLGVDLNALTTGTSGWGTSSGEVFTANDCAAVSAANAAVEFRTPPTQCNFVPFFDTTPALCEGLGTVENILFETWDSGSLPAGWSAGRRDLANPATFDNPDWSVVGNLPQGRGGFAAFVPDTVGLGNCVDDTEAGVQYLESPVITIPAGASVPRLTFTHLFGIELGWDGGNVKVSVNGGPFNLVPPTAFEFNEYKNAINGGGNDNPMAGEPGFTGGDGGQVVTAWGESWINLLGIAGPGDTIQFRMDMGFDGCNGVVGWYVDDFRVYSCSAEVPGLLCGNSILNIGESCDDGNKNTGDGCSDLCQVESGWICTDPTAGGTINAIPDGSFEAGVPNPYWTPFSTFTAIPGFPICNAGNCAGVDLANTGSWYVWIGGLTAGVTSSVEQVITVPSSESTMTLEVLRGVCDDVSDTLEIRLDGNLVGSVVCDAADSNYQTVSIDISAYADDGSHTLNIGGTVGGTNGSNTNFFVDDVFIFGGVAQPTPSICTPAPTSEPLVCNDAAVGFEFGILSPWSVVNNAGGPAWTNIAGAGEAGNYTGGAGDAATVSSDIYGPAEFDTELMIPVDLSGYTGASLRYLVNYQNFAALDFLDVDVSADGGASWTNLLSWNEDHGGFRTTPGEAVTLDLSAYAGMSNVLVRWHYYDPNSGDWDWYAQLDDVSLACDNNPNISVAPATLDATVTANRTTTQQLSIHNSGGSDLTWSISEAASLGATTVTAASTVATDLNSGIRPVDKAAQLGTFTMTAVANGQPASSNAQKEYRGPSNEVTKLMRDARAAVPGAEVVMDGGFEAGSPNPFWNEFSLNFGTPLCTVALCGTGSGTGPNSGDWWTWFGGIGVYEAGTMDQDITIPVGTATLSFYLEMSACDSPDDYVALFLDNTLLFVADGTSSICNSTGYALVSGDISALADGGVHNLYFQSETFSTNGGVSNIFIDDVSLDVQAPQACDSPSDIPWLSVAPTSGTTAAAATDTVDVTFNATGLTAGVYSAVLCIDSNDSDTPRAEVPVSMTVVEPIVINDYLLLTKTKTSYNQKPKPNAPAGVFTIKATFKNVSSADLKDISFKVAELSGGNLLLNADGGPGGVGSSVSVTRPNPLSPNRSLTVEFKIGLQQRAPFDFFVDAYGVVAGGVTAAVQTETNNGFRVHVSEDDFNNAQGETLYLPILTK